MIKPVLHIKRESSTEPLTYEENVFLVVTDDYSREMNQFYEMKGILRQFTVDRTPQQNKVAERRNRTLIKAARTMLADFKLPTIFWAEAVNTPYELFHGRTPTLSFMKPFGCFVTILNTIDHLGKFDGKADEGIFVGYSLNSNSFRVVNSRTRIVEQNLHIRFSESTPKVVGSGQDWLFDIDALTRIINYELIIKGTQSNGFVDHLGKFDGKADESIFVGYSLNSNAFRVVNSRTRIVEQNLHIRFSESTPKVVGVGQDWLFDIDALIRIINYELIVEGTQSNGFV
nr:hypothetical protein [Tanacetum cinerariifolium]